MPASALIDAVARDLRAMRIDDLAFRAECAAAIARRQERCLQVASPAVIASAGNVVRLERRAS